jgi:hypothetical protein
MLAYHAHIGGGEGQYGGFNALGYYKIKQGNAGPLGTYTILSVLPDEGSRFMALCLGFTPYLFESLDLPILHDYRSQFDVHYTPKDDKVKQYTCLI